MSIETDSRQQLQVEQCDDAAAWDAFVERNDGPAYTMWGWGDAVETCGHDRKYLIATDDGAIVGALPLFHMESRLFGEKLVSVPFATRGSVIADDDDLDAVTPVLLDRTKRLADDLGVDFVSLRGKDLGDDAPFERRTRFVTFRIPTDDDPDVVWEAMKGSRQRQITQAMENDSLTFSVGDSLEDLREFYRLYTRTMRGHGSPPMAFEFFRVLWEAFGEDHVRLGMIHRHGELVNASLDVALGSTVIQRNVVTEYEYRDLNGGSLLHWKTLQWASEEGYSAYDLGRTREGTGVYMFKKSFGGEKTWLHDHHYFPNGEVDLPNPDDEQYERLKDAWRRLPLPMTRILGPPIRRQISL